MTDPTTTPLGVAIVGCGIIGDIHAGAISRIPELRVVAVVDAVPEAAARLAGVIADDLGAPRPAEFGSIEQAIEAGGIGLVVVCTPSGLHVSLAEAAIASGASVVIEKPLDVDMPRARRIAALAQEAERRGLLVSVISQHRFDPASALVAEAAHAGVFGRITSAVASVPWWRTQDYYDSGQWRGTWELDGGGAVMNQGVHTVDLLVWLLGEPVEVSAVTGLLAHERVEVEDVAVATVRFASGALAVLHATTAGYPGLPVRLSVHGAAGSAVIEDDQLAYFATADGGDGDRAADLLPPEEVRGGRKPADAFTIGHWRQYLDIVAAIRDGRAPGVTVAAALRSLAVVRSVYLSATLGRPIAVAEVLDGVHDDVVVRTGGGA